MGERSGTKTKRWLIAGGAGRRRETYIVDELSKTLQYINGKSA
jgi:hypothetical protein